MYPIDVKENDRKKLNLAKQKFLKLNPDKMKVSHDDVLNAAIDFYLEKA